MRKTWIESSWMASNSLMTTQYFIDKFLVPKAGIEEFRQRTAINRDFIRKLPGFLDDAVYERSNENGDLVVITIAQWQSEEAVQRAKAAVQAYYQQIRFDPPEMMARLNIQMDRGVYTKLSS